MSASDTQLQTLLEMADMRLMSLLERAVFTSHLHKSFSRVLSERKKELFREIKDRDLVNDALGYLAAEDQREFIPKKRWRLAELVGESEAVLHHKHFYEGQRFISENFSAGNAAVCLFLPCHKIKPYSLSPTIQVVENALRARGLLEHVAMVVASVPGIIPIGFDRCYPFAYYNWDPRKETRATFTAYKQTLLIRAQAFFRKTRSDFTSHIAYFRPQSDVLQILIEAAKYEKVNLKIAPNKKTVEKIRRNNRAAWRYVGIKRQECIKDLCGVIKKELS